MAADHARETELRPRALAWTRRAQELIYDPLEPWEHGTVYRASRYPTYFDLNTVRVRDDPGGDVEALIGFADQALAGLEHRRIDFDCARGAEPLRATPAASRAPGWCGCTSKGPGPTSRDPGRRGQLRQRRRVAHRLARGGLPRPRGLGSSTPTRARSRLTLGNRLLAVHEDSRPVAFASLDLGEDEIEIGGLYVLPEYRGHGRGTALTQTAIAAAGDAKHQWICADDEDRPKQL